MLTFLNCFPWIWDFSEYIPLEQKGSKYRSNGNSISDEIARVSILKIAVEEGLIPSHHNVAKESKYSFAFV